MCECARLGPQKDPIDESQTHLDPFACPLGGINTAITFIESRTTAVGRAIEATTSEKSSTQKWGKMGGISCEPSKLRNHCARRPNCSLDQRCQGYSWSSHNLKESAKTRWKNKGLRGMNWQKLLGLYDVICHVSTPTYIYIYIYIVWFKLSYMYIGMCIYLLIRTM